MKQESKLGLKNKAVKQKRRYRKGEIIVNCPGCECERTLAYWDPELEYYIYLSEEPAFCLECQAQPKISTPANSLQPQIALA